MRYAKLAAESLILFPRHVSPYCHDCIIALCVAADFSPRIRHEVRMGQTVVTMVTQDMGVAIVPQALRGMHEDGVVLRPFSRDVGRSDVLAFRRADASEPGPALLVDTLQACAQAAASRRP